MKNLKLLLLIALATYGQVGMAMNALSQKQHEILLAQYLKAKELKGEAKSYTFSQVTISVVKGDITKTPVDAIVNAANPELSWGGGVCGAIFKAAGQNKLVDEIKKILNGASAIPVGEARVTPIAASTPGLPTINNDHLNVKYVVHAVGPDCRRDAHGKETEQGKNRVRLLADAYKNSILQADKVGIKSIAFPAISTAIFGYPIKDATPVALDALLTTAPQTGINRILCMFYDPFNPSSADEGYKLYTAYLDQKSQK